MSTTASSAAAPGVPPSASASGGRGSEGVEKKESSSAAASPSVAASNPTPPPPIRAATLPLPALNVYKKIPVIRKSTDTVTYEDANGNRQIVSDLGGAATTSAPSLLQPKKKLDIPTPQITLVESYEKDVPQTYPIPPSYVRFVRPSAEEVEDSCEYSADVEDEMWLDSNTKFGGAAKKGESKAEDEILTADPSITRREDNNEATSSEDEFDENLMVSTQRRHPRLSITTMARMLDALEKATGFETIITTSQAEHLISTKMPELIHAFTLPHLSTTQKSDKIPKTPPVTPKVVIQEVYNYWVSKRSKLKKPLLRCYWPVTASNDTNPHLVFRPREKEKYKLRKKRQNDMEAYRKMKQLRQDFDKVRVLLDLVRRRERLNKHIIDLQAECTEQRIYDIVDTSGLPRRSRWATRESIDDATNVPKYFDTSDKGSSKKKKRRRGSDRSASPPAPPHASAERSLTPLPPDPYSRSVPAGRDHGAGPTPTFAQPLINRESYATSWDDATPYVTSYVDSRPTPTFRFRHRARVGRGGRVVIDRVPRPGWAAGEGEGVRSCYVAGDGLPRFGGTVRPAGRLVDLLPKPLDEERISRKIEEMCAMESDDDDDSGVGLSAAAKLIDNPEENDGEEVLVPLDEWLDTDEQLWGEERFAIGPV